MNFQNPPVAVFMGIPSRLALAYPPALRSEIAQVVTPAGPDISGDNWSAHVGQLKQARVIMSTWGMPILTPEFLDAVPQLQAIFYAAGSVRCFATEEAYRRGVSIFSARMANAIPVAEYAAAAIILSLKQFWAYSRILRDGGAWSRTIPVAGTWRSTIGLVSLGATGRKTLERLSHLDCNILAFDPCVDPQSVGNLPVQMVSLEELFQRSDVISLHAPLLEETRGMIDGRLLRQMKPHATLINTSRGAVICENDLCGILTERPDLTAVLDVTDPEPPVPGSPLFQLPNVVLTPHISGSLNREIEMMGQWMADELRQFLMKRPLTHEVSLALLPLIA